MRSLSAAAVATNVAVAVTATDAAVGNCLLALLRSLAPCDVTGSMANCDPDCLRCTIHWLLLLCFLVCCYLLSFLAKTNNTTTTTFTRSTKQVSQPTNRQKSSDKLVSALACFPTLRFDGDWMWRSSSKSFEF